MTLLGQYRVGVELPFTRVWWSSYNMTLLGQYRVGVELPFTRVWWSSYNMTLLGHYRVRVGVARPFNTKVY